MAQIGTDPVFPETVIEADQAGLDSQPHAFGQPIEATMGLPRR
jgi:hypothetical protein